MSLKSLAAKVFAAVIARRTSRWVKRPVETQQKVFRELIANGRKTQFGIDHNFDWIRTHEAFVSRVPVRDYEDLKPYIDRVVQGEADILWPGRPILPKHPAQPPASSIYL